MWIDGLLRKMGARERRLIDVEAAEGPGSACWPAWRMLLWKTCDPERFGRWWQDHVHSCAACRETVRRVEKNAPTLAPAGATAAVQFVHHLFDASCARSLPWAAATATGLVSPTAEIPLVQYHRLENISDQGLRSIWCVTWDSAVFIILVGPRDTLAKWEYGAAVLDNEGARLCRLKPAGDDIAELLAPPGTLDHGSDALCLQCQMTAGELGGAPFTVPELLAGGIQLVPEAEAISRVQELIADLASRNRVASFLANVPAAPHDPQEAATLCFYLRLLDRQGRLPPEDRRQLAELEWVTDDLRDAFRSAPDAEANE